MNEGGLGGRLFCIWMGENCISLIIYTSREQVSTIASIFVTFHWLLCMMDFQIIQDNFRTIGSQYFGLRWFGTLGRPACVVELSWQLELHKKKKLKLSICYSTIRLFNAWYQSGSSDWHRYVNVTNRMPLDTLHQYVSPDHPQKAFLPNSNVQHCIA